ncbi:hypothetical protein M8J75_006673 [Diaphorina citri]|nr:hypothetical protein M8J75_006673 [Diaphorina citri]KAI5753065.1 hypothetical protein M8J77_023087 [Diaphorina citri]
MTSCVAQVLTDVRISKEKTIHHTDTKTRYWVSKMTSCVAQVLTDVRISKEKTIHHTDTKTLYWVSNS